MDTILFGSLLTELSNIPFYELDMEGAITYIFRQYNDESSKPEYEKVLWFDVLRNLEKETFAFEKIKGLPLCMCGVRVEKNKHLYIWGPILYRKLTITEKKIFEKMIKAKGIVPPIDCSLSKLEAEIACFLSSFNEPELTENEVSNWFKVKQTESNLSLVDEENLELDKLEYSLKVEDEGMLNHTYAEELKIWDVVRDGDVEGIKEQLKLPKPIYPLVIETNHMKNEEYMAVSTIAILSRIVIEAGITSMESFQLSDIYLKQISECRKLSDLERVVNEAHIAFTRLVANHTKKRSLNNYVEDCKKLIMTNLFKKISLSDIAIELEIQPAYLSRLFSENEGMTLTEYIYMQKIEMAKNMLRYSGKNVSEIANYLQFSSQSYFGKRFKHITGMTPKVYRQQYHPSKF